MIIETERKFLVTNDSWKKRIAGSEKMIQGYLAIENATVRIRIAGDRAFMTIKGHSSNNGISRKEFEYPVPPGDAGIMLEELCFKPLIEKIRYRVQEKDSHEWVVDVFSGANEGLVLAEIELGSEEETFIIPDWAGEEVSQRPEYRNSSLSANPYSLWKNQD